MKIRPALPADRERIHQILLAADLFTSQEVGWAMELVDLGLGDSVEYETYVLESPHSGPRRRVQGYVCFGPTPRSEGVFDLYWIAVDRAEQGKGYGQVLLRFVENEVRRVRGRLLLIETSARKSYEPTVRFYREAGYQEISRIKDFYRIEHDKLVFCKHLTEP